MTSDSCTVLIWWKTSRNNGPECYLGKGNPDMSIPHYKTDRRPFNPARYDSYLEMYGGVYGDMSDPVKRAEVVKMLRHRDAHVVASARRDLRRKIIERDTGDLIDELAVKRYQIEHCSAFRGWNIRNADIHQLRMIVNELRRREAIPRARS